MSKVNLLIYSEKNNYQAYGNSYTQLSISPQEGSTLKKPNEIRRLFDEYIEFEPER